MKHLILGNSAAGVSAAAKLRELNKSDAITIASFEETAPYAKIMLPDYIGNRIARDKLFIRDMSFYRDNGMKFLTGKKASRIFEEEGMVEFDDGSREFFDRLLLAVGSAPFVPDIQGLKDAEYFTVNSLADADNIRGKAVQRSSAVVVGGGLTGIEMAFALNRLNLKVHLIERSQNLLPSQLDGEASSIMAGFMEEEGIKVLTERVVQSIHNGKSSLVVELSDGHRIEAEMLIIAIGTRPNTGLVKNTSIKCARGILVDRYLKTSSDNIYAAGDVAEADADSATGCAPAYIWPNAMAQGKCAASNMSGLPTEFSFDSAAQNIVQLRDMPFCCMGIVKPEGDEYEILIKNDEKEKVYKKLVLKDNTVKGMVFVGDTKPARAVQGLIRNSTDISGVRHKLMDEDFKA